MIFYLLQWLCHNNNDNDDNVDDNNDNDNGNDNDFYDIYDMILTLEMRASIASKSFSITTSYCKTILSLIQISK